MKKIRFDASRLSEFDNLEINWVQKEKPEGHKVSVFTSFRPHNPTGEWVQVVPDRLAIYLKEEKFYFDEVG